MNQPMFTARKPLAPSDSRTTLLWRPKGSSQQDAEDQSKNQKESLLPLQLISSAIEQYVEETRLEIRWLKQLANPIPLGRTANSELHVVRP